MSIKNRKLQVFVSSTFTDLREERQAAVKAILSTGNIPAGMELFAAGDQSQMEDIREWIRESDVYLLILGGRYGSIEPVSGKSYTQLEYEYALEIGKAHFAVVVSETALDAKVKKHGLEMTERGSTEKYNEFKKLVTDTKMVEFWDDLKDIELAIHKSLARFGKREDLIGWVRGDKAIDDGGALAEEMARLGKENAELRRYIEGLKAVDNYNGLPFNHLYESFEITTYQIIDLKQHIRFVFEKEAMQDLLRYENEGLVSANDLLIAFSPFLNGFNQMHPNDFKGFLNFFQLNGIIKFVPKGHVVLPELTEVGRRYYLRLRTMEPYSSLQL
jgi:hypothetical protein